MAAEMAGWGQPRQGRLAPSWATACRGLRPALGDGGADTHDIRLGPGLVPRRPGPGLALSRAVRYENTQN